MCDPEGRPKDAPANLGEILSADRYHSAPFQVHALVNETCTLAAVPSDNLDFVIELKGGNAVAAMLSQLCSIKYCLLLLLALRKLDFKRIIVMRGSKLQRIERDSLALCRHRSLAEPSFSPTEANLRIFVHSRQHRSDDGPGRHRACDAGEGD